MQYKPWNHVLKYWQYISDWQYNSSTVQYSGAYLVWPGVAVGGGSAAEGGEGSPLHGLRGRAPRLRRLEAQVQGPRILKVPETVQRSEQRIQK